MWQFGCIVGTYSLKRLSLPEEPRPLEEKDCKELAEARASEKDQEEAKKEFDAMPHLTDEQQHVFDDIRECIDADGASDGPNLFYVDGPAGAGKTFLYKAVQKYIKGLGKIQLVVAMSGIAAILLDGGRTVHSRFKLPVPMPLEGAVANVKYDSGHAKLLRETALIIWDEAPNAASAVFDAVDKCLREILFGCCFYFTSLSLRPALRTTSPLLDPLKPTPSILTSHPATECDIWHASCE